MRLPIRSLLVTLATLLAAAAACPASPPAPRPNIVIVLVDDMGFSDIGCYGSEIPTPNLDRLAAGGLRFTQFYNTGRCCPTRASLLTGLYPHQAGVGHMTEDKGAPGYRGRLNDSCVTIAEVLRPAGYFTAMSGKWHVGQNHGVVPWERGFERSLNSPAGGFYFPADRYAQLFLNGQKLDNHGPPLPADWYTTDLWTDFGLKFVDEAREAKKPFFLYLAHNAPHFPLEAPAEEIARFRGKYKAGWDKLREQRHAKQIELGVVDKSWALSPRPEPVQAWDSLTPEQQDRFDQIMAIYSAVVAHMDAAVGRLVEGLRQRGVLDDTLILFLSDNGGNAESGPAGRLEAAPDGGPPGGPGSTVFEGQSWATLSNTPFRWYKHYNHEGGIATPLIAHWPARIKPAGGTGAAGALRQPPGHLIDLMPTCVELAGATYPQEAHGKPIPPMEGRSLVPAFDDKPIEREALYWEHEGNRAIRVGDWKLAAVGRDGPWELYDLKADRTELHDLAHKQPDRVKELAAKWEAWAKRVHALPYPADNATGGEAPKGKPGPFTLKPDATLNGEGAPAVTGKGLHITAKIAKPGRNGVIVAQGGTAVGYSLYLKDGRAAFATRHGGKLTVVEAPQALPQDTKELTVTLDAAGAVTIAADGKPIATGKTPGPMRRQPIDGLSVGRDTVAPVGPYDAPFPFDGAVDEVKLELLAKP